MRSWFFTPIASLQEPGDVQQAELTSALTLFIALLLGIGAMMTHNPIGKVLLPVLAAISLSSYALSRSRHFRIGGIILLSCWTIAGLGYAFLGRTDFGSSQALLLFIPLGYLLGMALVRLRSLLLLVLVSIAGTALLPLIDAPLDRSIISTIGVLTCMGGLALIIQRNRNMIERERLRALTEKNHELQLLHTSLQKANQDLGTRLVERETLIQELEAKNAELERFTYTVSHDLKAPLFTINGFLGYLESDAASGNLERFAADRQRIQDAVGRMKSLLDNLLEISRLGRLMNPSERIEFSGLVREALDNLRSQLDAGRVKVTIQAGLPAVFGDRERLLEVVQNLIDNAVKFMGRQSDPHIEIGQHGVEEGKPVLFVQDNGIGIAPEFHERVFGLFNKLDPRSEGTGVGLALVKRIVEIHGGRAWIVSQEGKGTTFYFSLPGAA